MSLLIGAVFILALFFYMRVIFTKANLAFEHLKSKGITEDGPEFRKESVALRQKYGGLAIFYTQQMLKVADLYNPPISL